MELAAEQLRVPKAKFDQPEIYADDKKIFEHLLKVAPTGEVVVEGGNLAAGEKTTDYAVDETYLNNCVSHPPHGTAYGSGENGGK